MGLLDGRVAVVIGAAGPDNMGQAIARRFAEEGASVVVAGRHEGHLAELAREIGGDWATCDVRDKVQLQSVAMAAEGRFGPPSIAVNCSGHGLMEKLLQTSEAQIDALMDLQFKGTYFFLQVFAEAAANAGGGSLIQVSSASVHALLFNHAAYIGTKAGGDALVRCFANEFGAKGVKVNTIAPGLTATPMAADAVELPGLEEAFLNEYPLGRIGTATDVANAAAWLASEESFMTGEILQINGGLTLRRNPLPWEINASMREARARGSGGD
jgi:NAD(P)-dependent dehydrogenase (short-subunit alcohol dehydrogenase family)